MDARAPVVLADNFREGSRILDTRIVQYYNGPRFVVHDQFFVARDRVFCRA